MLLQSRFAPAILSRSLRRACACCRAARRPMGAGAITRARGAKCPPAKPAACARPAAACGNPPARAAVNVGAATRVRAAVRSRGCAVGACACAGAGVRGEIGGRRRTGGEPTACEPSTALRESALCCHSVRARRAARCFTKHVRARPALCTFRRPRVGLSPQASVVLLRSNHRAARTRDQPVPVPVSIPPDGPPCGRDRAGVRPRRALRAASPQPPPGTLQCYTHARTRRLGPL